MNKVRTFNIIPPTLFLGLATALSAVFGVYRDHLLAKTFGATAGDGIYNLDVYYAAFRIPDLLYKLLIFGTISAAFIPIFTQYKRDGKMKDAWSFASSMLHLTLVGVLIIAGGTYFLAPYAVHLVAGGFTDAQLELTVQLMRILLVSPILFAVSSVIMSIQDSFKCFFFRSLAPILYNIGIIAGIMYFATDFGVVGVTYGVLIGAALQLLFQLPAFWQVGYKHYWILGWKRKDVRKAFLLIGPRMLGLSLHQISMLVNTLIASFLMTGSITVFYLAENLQLLPLSVISISFAITSFASLSELASEEDTKPFTDKLRKVLQQVLFLTIPATVGLLILRNYIIEVIFVSGKFSATDAALTSDVLGYLLVGLFAISMIPILSRGFYAYHNTKIPLLASATGAGVGVGGSLLSAFVFGWGIEGIAMSHSFGAIVNCVILYVFAHKKLGYDLLDWGNVVKMVVVALIMGVLTSSLKAILPFEGDFISKITVLGILVLTGAVLYFIFAHFFRVPENDLLWRHLFKKMGLVKDK